MSDPCPPVGATPGEGNGDEVTDLEKACAVAHHYRLDVFGVQALLADLPDESVAVLLRHIEGLA